MLLSVCEKIAMTRIKHKMISKRMLRTAANNFINSSVARARIHVAATTTAAAAAAARIVLFHLTALLYEYLVRFLLLLLLLQCQHRQQVAAVVRFLLCWMFGN